jgi:hypothetical protein
MHLHLNVLNPVKSVRRPAIPPHTCTVLVILGKLLEILVRTRGLGWLVGTCGQQKVLKVGCKKLFLEKRKVYHLIRIKESGQPRVELNSCTVH